MAPLRSDHQPVENPVCNKSRFPSRSRTPVLAKGETGVGFAQATPADMGNTILRTAFACLVYATAGFLLYRARVFSDSVLLDSDLVVFALPAAVAFLAMFGILMNALPGSPFARRLAAALVAAVLVALSFLSYLSVAGNMYGT